MKSIYDSIQNPKDLLRYVSVHGLSTSQEDIVRVQDIFGHASLDELIALANDNGRMDEDGKPDPRGSFSTGKKGLSSVFYSVLFNIWNWEDATRFYNTYSNFPVIDNQKELELLRIKESEAKEQVTRLENTVAEVKSQFEKEKDRAYRAEHDLFEAEKRLNEKDNEIVRLKAKLYDMIMKG